MNSIKTFWSPELKKERAVRKDEATKMAVWKEQYRVVQEETQVCVCKCMCVYFCGEQYPIQLFRLFSFVAQSQSQITNE